jgi:hypothetical protein
LSTYSSRVEGQLRCVKVEYLSYLISRITLNSLIEVVRLLIIRLLTYSITKPNTLPNLTKRLSGTNLYYVSLILLLLNKEPMYIVLVSNLEDISVFFLYIRALCLVLLQFL